MYPQYREHYLPAMTLSQIEAIPEKETAPVIIPTGAIEQHGHHLPVGVDSFMGQAWLENTLPKLDASVPCYVAPPITMGKSNEHVGFPGTLMISKKSLRRLLRSIVHQLYDWGFRTMAILNTHGGNISVVLYTIRELQSELDVNIGVLPHGGVDYGISEQEATYGFHAGEIETAWLLEITDGLVDMSRAAKEFPASIEDKAELKPEGAPATFSWVTADVSETGVMGDATIATQEKGKRWLEMASAKYAERIEVLYHWAKTH